MTIQRYYESRSEAEKRLRIGRLIYTTGGDPETLAAVTSVTTAKTLDGWIATIECRPATEEEKLSVRKTAMEKELLDLAKSITYGGGWQNRINDPVTAENLARHAALKSQLEAM